MCYTVADMSDSEKGSEYAWALAEAKVAANQGETKVANAYEDDAAYIKSLVKDDAEFQEGIRKYEEWRQKYPK